MVFTPQSSSFESTTKELVAGITHLHHTVDHIEVAHTGCHYDAVMSKNGEKLPQPDLRFGQEGPSDEFVVK